MRHLQQVHLLSYLAPPTLSNQTSSSKMDATITYNEVTALVGVNIPSLEPHPNFKQIQNLCRHFKHAFQRLPCPQSLQHGWKGMVMARELYTLLTVTPFYLPINPGNALIYVPPVVMGKPVNNAPLTRTDQATINTCFNRLKHYFMLMQNIKRACFTALDARINDPFKVSNMANGHGWHADMRVIDILDQLKNIYGKPTSSALKANNNIFCSRYLAADAPKVLFRLNEDCVKVA
jgi:hypothetical protein